MQVERRAVVGGCALAGVAVLTEVARYLAEYSGVQIHAYQSFIGIAGPLILVAFGAGYLTTVERTAPGTVVHGFLPGSLLYGSGLLGFHWLENYHSLSAVVDILPIHLVLTAAFVLMTALGAFGGHLAGQLLQERPR